MMRGDHGRHVPIRAHAGRGRVAAVLAVVAGLLLLAGSGVVIWRDQGVTEVGVDEAARLGNATDSAQGAGVPLADGRALPSNTPEPPTRLEIPAIGLTAGVDRVGIDPTSGEFDVPPSVDRVGWYRFGPGLDAAAGSVVIAGHVDSAEQGPGAFFRLPELSPGDVVEVSDGEDTTYEFEVVGREVYAKDEVPLERFFARDGAPRLTLITCGGAFDPDAGSYQDNVVVTAAPVR